ncbi:hypothetical protein [Treponema pectinovorum]|uniref:hypothetical protein n=1 Tax=Treponema pectinovorum TaxID=164 RepID=UPI0011CCCA9D|nr:hypothetical protein [Treponema pectinovorum]
MKLSKVLITTAALVAAFAFVGCKDDEESAFSGKKVDFDNSYITVDTSGNVKHAKSTDIGAVANTANYYRAFKKLATKHYGSTCTITITPNDKNTFEGVAGFVFNMKDSASTTDAYSFIVAAVQYNGATKQLRTYISSYEDALLKDNNYTTVSNFTKDGTTPATENQILPASGTFHDFATTDFKIDDKGNVVVSIKVEQNEDGSYVVSYYKTLADAQASKNVVKTVNITKAQSGLAKKTQMKMAMYANIYPAKHLTAEFKFTDTKGEVLPFEDEVIEY